MDWNPIDTAMTPWRERIHSLVRDELKIGAEKGCFNCRYFENYTDDRGTEHRGCRPDVSDDGRRGDWPYVGHQYGEAPVGGKPARVLFVSMDRPWRGGEERFYTFSRDQAVWRDGAYSRGNPHMGGVDVELEYLLDDSVTKDDRCQQFALVNSVLCGPPAATTRSGKPSMASRSTGVMKDNCLHHMKRVILELEPDIVIAQGGWPNHGVRRLLGEGGQKQEVDSWENGRAGRSHRQASLLKGAVEGGRPALFLLTAHPARYPGFSWRNGKLPDELKCAITRIRMEYAPTA